MYVYIKNAHGYSHAQVHVCVEIEWLDPSCPLLRATVGDSSASGTSMSGFSWTGYVSKSIKTGRAIREVIEMDPSTNQTITHKFEFYKRVHLPVKFIWSLIESPTAKTVLIKLVHFILPNGKYGKLLNMWNHPSVLEPPRPSNIECTCFSAETDPFVKYQSLVRLWLFLLLMEW